MEHFKGAVNKETDNHTYSHIPSDHADTQTEDPHKLFAVGLYKSYRNPLQRQLSEAIIIRRERAKGKTLLNFKTEYNCCMIPELITTGTSPIEQYRDMEKDEVHQVIIGADLSSPITLANM